MSLQQSFEIERRPVIVSFPENPAFTETYGFVGSQGVVFLEGQQIIPLGKTSDTVLLFMHPATTLNLMPLPAAMARAGHHVLCCGSRYAKVDTSLIMEKVVADLGAYIRHARDRLGYKKFAIVGWSGGGSLALFYQSQAERPTIVDTPAGDPYDLASMELPQADAVMFVAAHIGRARTLSEWIDPSIRNELDPDDRDSELDLFSPANPSKPPFSSEFIARYRAAQLSRMRKITAWVRDTLSTLRRRGGAELERPFLIHRTMADLRWVDPSIEPNDRKPNWCYIGAPETANTGPAGLARFSTLRGWLSQWSVDDTRADALACARKVSTPLLVIENGADDAVPTSHPQEVFASASMKDKTYKIINRATHYYKDQPEQLQAASAEITRWLEDRDLFSR